MKNMDLSKQLSNCKPIVIASHPRSGTHLTIDVFRRQYRQCQSWKFPLERNDRLYLNIDSLMQKQGRLDEKTAVSILKRCKRPLIKTHAWPDLKAWFDPQQHDQLPRHWVEWLKENATFVYVYRDPRKVLCSYQLFMEVHTKQSRTPIDKFIREIDEHQVNRVRAWAQHIRAWFDEPNIITAKFEDIMKNSQPTLAKLGADLNIDFLDVKPYLPPKSKGLWHSRLNRLIAIKPTSTAILGVENNERPLKWEEACSEQDTQFLKDESDNLLSELGFDD